MSWEFKDAGQSPLQESTNMLAGAKAGSTLGFAGQNGFPTLPTTGPHQRLKTILGNQAIQGGKKGNRLNLAPGLNLPTHEVVKKESQTDGLGAKSGVK